MAKSEIKDTEDTKISSSPSMSFSEYLRTFGDRIHKYTAAYLKPIYNGSLKTKDDWDKEMKAQGVNI